jgi:hypothetical protein
MCQMGPKQSAAVNRFNWPAQVGFATGTLRKEQIGSGSVWDQPQCRSLLNELIFGHMKRHDDTLRAPIAGN